MSKPFHESIVDAIDRAKRQDELETLAALIKDTKIVRDHDAIVSAWKDRVDLICHDNGNYMGVPHHVEQEALAMHGVIT